MKQTTILMLFVSLLLGVQIQAQVTKEKSYMQKLIEENNIPNYKYEKFWTLLDRNYITYTPSEKWEVVSDSMTAICSDKNCPIRNILGRKDGKLAYKDGKCLVAIEVNKPVDKMKLHSPLFPYKYEKIRQNMLNHVGNCYEWGKKFRSRSMQDFKDLEMLITRYPADSAKSIFKGTTMFIYPLDFKGEICEEKYRYGRGVVVLGKYNVPIYLYFLMTADSINDFDKYLAELKGMFTFQDLNLKENVDSK